MYRIQPNYRIVCLTFSIFKSIESLGVKIHSNKTIQHTYDVVF